MTSPPQSALADFTPLYPALPQDTLIKQGVAQNILPGTTTQLYSGPIDRNGYQIDFDALAVSGAVTQLYSVFIDFDDMAGATLLDRLLFWCLASEVSPSDANCHISGRGPTGGSYMTLSVHNYDTSDYALNWCLYGSGRLYTRHDWRSISNNSVNLDTPDSDPSAFLLGQLGLQGIFATAQTRLCALYAGKAQFCLVNQTNTQPVPYAIWQMDYGLPAGSQQVYLADSVLAVSADGPPNSLTLPLTLPRAPVFISAGPCSASQQVTWSLIGQDLG